MPRPLRLQFDGALYHVTSRGNGKHDIFLSDRDRRFFLKILQEIVSDFNWVIYSYCLMDNHYHLLVETREANLSLGMRDLNSLYSMHFNDMHRKIGHVMQGRFHSPLVTEEKHLMILSAYIVRNPVEAGIVKYPAEWSWSSFRATVGIIRPPWFLDASKILDLFSSDRQKAVEAYQRYVDLSAEQNDFEVVRKESGTAVRPTLVSLFRDVSDKNSRDEQIRKAINQYDYQGQEIAGYLGFTRSTISKVMSSNKDASQLRELETRRLMKKGLRVIRDSSIGDTLDNKSKNTT